MSNDLPAPISEDEYSAIEAAVMETARGRWFLAEYARRNRSADTQLVLDAVNRLEQVVKSGASPAAGSVDDIKLDLIDMAEAIARTRSEIRSLHSEDKADRFVDATEELDAVVSATEKATNEILGSAEKIQELVWTVLERGEAAEECAKIDELIIDVYTGCSFQDITGQRIQKVVQALRYVESRVNAMIDIWNLRGAEPDAEAGSNENAEDNARPDAHLLNGPAREGEGIQQDQIDDLMASQQPEIVNPDPAVLDWSDEGDPVTEDGGEIDVLDIAPEDSEPAELDDQPALAQARDADDFGATDATDTSDALEATDEAGPGATEPAGISNLDEDLFDETAGDGDRLTEIQAMALSS